MVHDAAVEADETFSVALGALTGLLSGVSAGDIQVVGSPQTGTIANDDTEVSVSVTPSSVLEDGATNLVYTFTRSGEMDAALTVNFDVSGDATLGSDYTPTGADSFSATVGTVTFAAGSSTATVTVDPTADTEVEADETVIFTIASGAGYTIATSSMATGTIANDDTTVNVAVTPSSVLEDGTTNLVYTFTRSGETDSALTVNFDVSGDATLGSDYTQTGAASFSATVGTVTFAAGSSTAVVTVDPTADTEVEPDETVVLTIASGAGYTIATSSMATGTIANDDTEVSVSVTPSSVLEDGATNLVYTFTRSGVTDAALTVNFDVSGDATLGSDYTQTGAASFSATVGTVTFAAGSSTAVVTVDPTADTEVEPDETVVLTIASGAGYTIATSSMATGTIANDDTEVSVSVTPSSVLEDGTTNLVYTFTRSGETDSALTVNFGTSGTAEGSDFSADASGSVIIPAGVSSVSVTVNPTADSVVEADETVILTVLGGSGYQVGTSSTATGTIENDDTEVSVSVTPSSVLEDGATNLVYTFTRSGETDSALTVNFDVSGDATLGSDYTPTGAASFSATVGTVTFAAGSSTATITVDPTADTDVEPDETVIFTIAAGAGYTIATPNTATGTIENDDTTVNVAVTPSSVLEDGTTNLVYTFTRSGETDSALTVNFGTSGTAEGSDFSADASGSVIIPAGVSSVSVTVNPTADSVVEADETVILTVLGGSGYQVGTSSTATGTIANDDTSTLTLAGVTSSQAERDRGDGDELHVQRDAGERSVRRVRSGVQHERRHGDGVG